ncbi:hypothetical protein KKB99_07130 [bacterium]|nr:hypothetical protein [bacterium]MBU1025764.1 hypothetical protein [bacterium]
MSSLDEFTSSLKRLGKKLTFEGRRTANLARLKIDLKSLDTQRREVMTRLGEKVFDLKKRRAFQDEGLIEPLREQFDELYDLEKKIETILEEIQKISLMQDTNYEPVITVDEEPHEKSGVNGGDDSRPQYADKPKNERPPE